MTIRFTGVLSLLLR
ncbi:hypothetical protein CGLO_14197 [Colletotrichum gloeosporioides Cg-14]|uniref:Uncharacterized protein n=1 Tax=Colletotrichum gloeosporioides (strain Cg-14) TaxID=1237896 RepID=T0K4D6_COLGC|nr:hypothetical protein CGLO_14197 [Colletotrichum gloeosporioides Cg-14]